MFGEFFREIHRLFCHRAYLPGRFGDELLPAPVQFLHIHSQSVLETMCNIAGILDAVQKFAHFFITVSLRNEIDERLPPFIYALKAVIIQVFQVGQIAVHHHIADIHIRFGIHSEPRFIFRQPFDEP